MKLNEYLMQDINDTGYIPKRNVKGTKAKHNYELIATYNSNGEYTYHILCDREHLEALRPQFEGVVQHSDPSYWGAWKFKDMEDMMDQALDRDNKYYDICLRLWDDNSDSTFDSSGHYNPYKYYTINSSDSGIESLRPKISRINEIIGIAKHFEYYFDEINIDEVEKICINHTEESF